MDSDVKKKVRKYYGKIASQVGSRAGKGCCSSTSSCGDVSESALIYADENFRDLPREAVDASLGCANPIAFADLQAGETVLDLGSGGGINVFMAARKVGEQGKVYGLDMTDEMLALANKNKERLKAGNVEFIKGFIEDIPLEASQVDIIISNCVINLSDDKEKTFREAYRVLKAGGRLAIADIIRLKDLPSEFLDQVELWCECLSGALKLEEYQSILEKTGFMDIEVKPIHLYSKAMIKTTFLSDKKVADALKGIDLELVDGAFAGASIKAKK